MTYVRFGLTYVRFGRYSFRMGSPCLELGSWELFSSGSSSGWVSSSFGRPVCSEVGECPVFRCLRFLRGLGLYPSRQHRSRSLTCFYWPCRLSPSPVGSVCFGGITVIPFTWAFMRWPYTHGGSLAALPEVGLLAFCQGASKSLPYPSPGCEVDASVFGIAVRTLLQATPLTRSMESFPTPGQGLSVSAFQGCCSALKVFSFWSVGSSRSPELLRCPRNFSWSGDPVQFLVTLPGWSLWFFRTWLGLRGAPPDV